jgi:Protein of unknown function (DUF2917)
MNLQHRSGPRHALRAVTQHLTAGQAIALSPGPGELSVIDGRVWLTRRGEVADHVLQPGQRLHLDGDVGAVIEAWDRGVGAAVRWQPQPQAQARPRAAFLAGALVLLAGLAARVARGLAAATLRFEALARKAASSARRAQGCIHIGDSMACGGTVQ